jgi:Na+/H+ antiporter NhaA
MARQQPKTIDVRRLAERLAGAAAVYDPSLLLQLRAAQSPADAPPPPPDRANRRRALGGETGGALLLVAAVAVALVWATSSWGPSYSDFWRAPVAVSLGPWTLGADLRTWINEGLMTLFFLVVGLEAKRDLGELRERRRPTAPALAGLGVVALLVIGFVSPARMDPAALIVAAALLALLLSMRAIAGRQFRARGSSSTALWALSILIGVALWLALFESGIDAVITGLLVGLLADAFEPEDERLARSGALARAFREQPTPALSSSARAGVAAVISPNDRLHYRLRPWTSRVVVPIFALANAGLLIDGHLLAATATSAITSGIVLAYTVGKPLGIVIAARAPSRHSVLRRPAVTAPCLAR